MLPKTVLLVGISHKTAPVDVRERFSLSCAQQTQVMEELLAAGGIDEVFVLSTCNRTEIMAALTPSSDAGSNQGAVWLRECLARRGGMSLEACKEYLYTYGGLSAVEHLFNVAGGLDSAIYGEHQVLRQIREAYKAAAGSGYLGPVLDCLLRRAIWTGRRVRSEASLPSSRQSVGTAAVDLALRTFGGLTSKQVTVIGAGNTARLVIDALIKAQARDIAMMNRTFSKAVESARAFGVRALGLGDLEAALSSADVVISATAAPNYVIWAESVRQAMALRAGRPLLLIDLAVPRDVEPSSADVEGVSLYTVDDISAEGKAVLPEARLVAAGVVESGLNWVRAWAKGRQAASAVSALKNLVEQIRRDAIEDACRKNPGLSERQRAVLEEATRSMVGKMLHGHIVALKGKVRVDGPSASDESPDYTSGKTFYPAMLDIAGKHCLVVGGGPVAYRKLRSLLECGAKVTVISPRVLPPIRALAESGQIRWLNREWAAGDGTGYLLAVAATNVRTVNAAIAEECSRCGTLTNVVDDPDACAYIVPAVVRKGDLIVAISTSGTDPAWAKKIRVRLDEMIDDERW